MKKPAFSIMLAEFPGNGTSHRATNRYIHQLLWKVWPKDKRINRVRFFDESSTPIDMVRNLAIKNCRDNGIDYCFMIDSDMSPDCEYEGKKFWETSWDWMYKRRMEECEFAKKHEEVLRSKQENADVWLADMLMEKYPPATIGAPYCGPPPHENVYLFKWDNFESNTPNFNYTLSQVPRDSAALYTGIWEVPALPTGLILYDVRVFNTLPPPWFYYEFSDPPYNTHKSSTEDVVQTRNAHLCGLPQFCNWDAWAGHIKPKLVGKPKSILIKDIPTALATAIRSGITENHKVVMVRRRDDAPDSHPKVISKPVS